MSGQNPSDSFDSHPENSGCSNDDFEQVDAPGSGYYQHHNSGDADGPDEVGGSGYDYDYDPEQDGEISTTTANAREEEPEEDRYAAGASEAYNTRTGGEPLISLGDDDSYDSHWVGVQPSAPVPDIEPVLDFASSTAADILSTIAPNASPPSAHYTEPAAFSPSYEDDFGINEAEAEATEEEEPQEQPEIETEPYLDESNIIKDFTTAILQGQAESVSSTSTSEPLPSSVQVDKRTEEAPKGSFLRGLDPRDTYKEEVEEEVTTSQPTFFQDLIYWRDVKTTGAVFGSILVVLLSLAFLSVISVVAYLSLAVLALTFSFVIYKKIMSAVQKSGDGHPFKSLLDKDISLSEEKLRTVIKTTLKNVNCTAKELRHLFLVEDIVDSVKLGIILWALTYIGSWFSDMALIIIAVVVVFTVPKLYDTYQVQIDNYIGLARAQINTYLSIIQSKVPFLKKKEKTH